MTRAKAMRTVLVVTAFIATLLAGEAMTALAATDAPADVVTAKSVEDLALRWFEQMRTGEIDRTQLTPEYSAQLTDEAVRQLSQFLKKYEYGAAPTGAQILVQRSIGNQRFYVVKIVFPRGDAASLLLGFDRQGKITGISLMSMAGD
jgi:hypothetical protein